jgi:Flp pilus assembly protein TadD
MLAWYSPQSIARYSLREAGVLLYDGRYTEALALYEKMLPYDNTPQTRLLLSYAYLARRDAQRAEIQARAAISSSRGSLLSASWAQLGRVLAFSGREDEAKEAWSASVQADPAGAQARSSLWHLALLAWSKQDTGSFTHLFEELLTGDDVYAVSARIKLAQSYAPTDASRSLHLLSEAEAQLGVRGQGSGVSNLGHSALPDLRVPGLREGLSYGAMDRLISSLRDAHQQAESARKAGADVGVLASLWGSAYLQQGEPALARRYMEQAASSHPDSSDVQARLGLALLADGDVGNALKHLQAATRLGPDNPLPRHALASIYMSRKEWDLAAAELRTLRKLEPDGITALSEVAEYFKLRGLYEEAEANLREAARLQRTFGPKPGEVDASLALARFYTDVRGQGCERGLPAAQDSLSLHPDDPDSLDAVGWSLVLCNDARSATSLVERAVSQAPDVPRFRYHLAKAYALIGRIEEARTQYTRVMDLDPGGLWERLAQSDMARLDQRGVAD